MAGTNNNWYIYNNILHIGAAVPSGITAAASGTYVGNNSNDTMDWYQYSSSVTEVVIEDDCLGNPNLTSTQWWFADFISLTTGNWDNLDVSSVTNMEGMFLGCTETSFNPVLNWNTSNVTSMGSMFLDCSGAAFNPTLNWDTSNVTDMAGMFEDCSGVAFNPTLNFDTSNVTNMAGMFKNCSNVVHIYTNNWDLSNLTSYGGYQMFSGCTNLVGGNGTSYDSSKIDKTYARIDSSTLPGYFTRSSLPYSAYYKNNDTWINFGNFAYPTGTIIMQNIFYDPHLIYGGTWKLHNNKKILAIDNHGTVKNLDPSFIWERTDTVTSGKIYLNTNSAWNNALDMFYPIGAIYRTTSNTSPATSFGGTWEEASGKLILGIDEKGTIYQDDSIKTWERTG